MQLIPHASDFVLHTPLVVAVRHASRKNEGIGAAGAFHNVVVELRHTNVPGDARAHLLEIQIGVAGSSIGLRAARNPVSGQIIRGRGDRKEEQGEKESRSDHRPRFE